MFPFDCEYTHQVGMIGSYLGLPDSNNITEQNFRGTKLNIMAFTIVHKSQKYQQNDQSKCPCPLLTQGVAIDKL